MNNQQAYNQWAENYDTVHNKTRDLEALALRRSLADLTPDDVLEIGCGTGKNTEWLLTMGRKITGSDFSPEMLAKAREKIKAGHVDFKQLDLRHEWPFEADRFDLITCSLVLEHIEDLDFVFSQAYKVLRNNGRFYIGELHPFKQYQGSKARFDTENGVFELECFIHNISAFYECSRKNGLVCIELREWFDGDDPTSVPRLLSMIFLKAE
jgi:ubiquinone/menaquinone biosynthesis C-methylase UbiE